MVKVSYKSHKVSNFHSSRSTATKNYLMSSRVRSSCFIRILKLELILFLLIKKLNERTWWGPTWIWWSSRESREAGWRKWSTPQLKIGKYRIVLCIVLKQTYIPVWLGADIYTRRRSDPWTPCWESCRPLPARAFWCPWSSASSSSLRAARSQACGCPRPSLCLNHYHYCHCYHLHYHNLLYWPPMQEWRIF